MVACVSCSGRTCYAYMAQVVLIYIYIYIVYVCVYACVNIYIYTMLVNHSSVSDHRC